MGIMVSSFCWVLQDLDHQPYVQEWSQEPGHPHITYEYPSMREAAVYYRGLFDYLYYSGGGLFLLIDIV